MCAPNLLITAACLTSLALSTTSPAIAQTVLLQEDFEDGAIPAGWLIASTLPVMWRVSDSGDCSMPSRMVAYNRANLCNYVGTTFSTAGWLGTTPFDLQGSRPLRVEFDYAMQIDASQDDVELRLESVDGSVSSLLLADASGLINDGALHHASFDVSDPIAFAASPARLSFAFHADSSGNAGLGLMFDNLRISLDAAGVPFCFGDPVSGGCPCANFGSLGAGCANSTGVGAILESQGSALVALDDMHLFARQARPNSTGVIVQGSSTITLPFKDGVLCAGNPTVRLEFIQLDAAGLGSTQSSITDSGSVHPGDTRIYQLWYRDPAVSPCGFGSNLSNALSVHWQ